MAINAEFYIQAAIFLFEISAVLIFNVYYVAKYAHNDDSQFAKSKIVKVLIIIAYSLPTFLILIVPLDCTISATHDGDHGIAE
jgi:hypothetical protein